MKKTLCTLLALVIVLSCLPIMASAEGGGALSASSAISGNTLTLTVNYSGDPLLSYAINLNYDHEMLQFVSGTALAGSCGANKAGGAAATNSLAGTFVTATFTVLKPCGVASISVSPAEMKFSGGENASVSGASTSANVGSHDWNDWQTIQTPDHNNKGSKTRSCKNCTASETEEIPVIAHDFSGAWQSDNTNHWKLCTCSAIDQLAAHTLTWVVTKAVDNVNCIDGEETEQCSVCGFTTGNTRPVNHTHAWTWVVDKAATTSTTGLKHQECKCGARQNENTLISRIHVHSYSSKWEYDEEEHWHICACGGKSNIAEHTFEWVVDKQPTDTEPGLKHEKCTICGYEKTEQEEIPVDHVHSYDENKWSSDENQHWHICSCGEREGVEDHDFIWVTDEEAAVGVAGKRHQECSACGYQNGVEEEIPALEEEPAAPARNNALIWGLCGAGLLFLFLFFILGKKKKKEEEEAKK